MFGQRAHDPTLSFSKRCRDVTCATDSHIDREIVD